MGLEFNDTKESVEERTESTNYEGGESYDPDSPELALTKNVITNLLEDSYYESAEDSFDDVKRETGRVLDTNPEFVLKLAKYARQEENLRQIPQLLLVLAANDSPASDDEPVTEDHGAYYVRDYAESIMSRADEPLQVLGMQEALYGTSIPNSLRDGIEDALHNYNEYQYAKWDRPNREWQYRDLMNLVHPEPRDDERSRVFEKIAHGELDKYDVEPLTQEDTWEDEMSEDDDRDSAEVWRDQLRENEEGYSMPIFARVRNVRNMLEDGLTGEEIFGDQTGPPVTDDWVRNSGLYPFRFYQAYNAVRDSSSAPNDRYALEWLEDAMKVATENLPDTFDNTFAAVDTSDSMTTTVSGDSDLQCVEIGGLFGSMMIERDSDIGVFASDFEYLDLDPRNPLTTNTETIAQRGGGSTNGWKIPSSLREDNRQYDRVIVFTDLQMWDSTGSSLGFGSRGNSRSFKDEWGAYKEEIAPDATLYLIDLQYNGDLVTPEGTEGVYNISGWSENVLDFIEKMESAGDMVTEIEAVEPDR